MYALRSSCPGMDDCIDACIRNGDEGTRVECEDVCEEMCIICGDTKDTEPCTLQ